MLGITAEQEHQVEIYYKKMEAALRSCEPADREVTESVITRIYEKAGRGKPAFVWFSSPIACLLAAEKEAPRSLSTGSVGADISKILDEAVSQNAPQSGYSFLQHRILRTVQEDLSPTEVFTVLNRFVRFSGYSWLGQFDAHWVASYRINEILGVPFSTAAQESLCLLESLVSSCGGWIPLEGKCFISDRCSLLYLNDDNVLRTARPGDYVVKYRDGVALYKTE